MADGFFSKESAQALAEIVHAARGRVVSENEWFTLNVVKFSGERRSASIKVREVRQSQTLSSAKQEVVYCQTEQGRDVTIYLPYPEPLSEGGSLQVREIGVAEILIDGSDLTSSQ